jgi:hypothetical protein
MATKRETNAVYAAGLVQGIALVTFPAASTIFTDPSQYGLSNTQYGTMFLPQVVTAITGALLSGRGVPGSQRRGQVTGTGHQATHSVAGTATPAEPAAV